MDDKLCIRIEVKGQPALPVRSDDGSRNQTHPMHWVKRNPTRKHAYFVGQITMFDHFLVLLFLSLFLHLFFSCICFFFLFPFSFPFSIDFFHFLLISRFFFLFIGEPNYISKGYVFHSGVPSTNSLWRQGQGTQGMIQTGSPPMPEMFQ